MSQPLESGRVWFGGFPAASTEWERVNVCVMIEDRCPLSVFSRPPSPRRKGSGWGDSSSGKPLVAVHCQVLAVRLRSWGPPLLAGHGRGPWGELSVPLAPVYERWRGLAESVFFWTCFSQGLPSFLVWPLHWVTAQAQPGVPPTGVRRGTSRRKLRVPSRIPRNHWLKCFPLIAHVLAHWILIK